MYGPMWSFYSCMDLMTLDTGFPRVDELSTDPRGSGRPSMVLELR